jgi:hypothetical protein
VDKLTAESTTLASSAIMREPSTEHARFILTKEGFTVSDIRPSPPDRRADLRVHFGREEYVLEAKLRKPHAGWHELMEQVHQNGYGWTSRQIMPWNALSSMIREAHNQLVATPAGDDAFRILWLVALHDDDEFVISCVEKRLLGSVEVLPVDPHILAIGETKVCYYYTSNDFERCTGIDAAVLGTRSGGKLFVNHFSDRREAFRNTKLHDMFAVRGAVVDPELAVASGRAFMIGREFSGRRDGRAQWQYLKDHYGVATTVMQEFEFTGRVVVPVKP